MRYLCLIYGDEKWWDKASEAEKQQGMAEYNAFTENVKKNGTRWLLPHQREGPE